MNKLCSHGCHFFENKSGIPITPYKEHIIYRSECLNLFEGHVSLKSVVNKNVKIFSCSIDKIGNVY